MTSTLPARPDLEHLRREAKRLLRLLQRSDSAALARLDVHAPGRPPMLSTAQLILAREHGFTSWDQMKSVVTTLSSGGIRYDTIGRGYADYRRPDPRIAAAIHGALTGMRTVVNVGAGTGSYEPTDRPVIPVEPSVAMSLQRDPSLPPAVLGVAESLPLPDKSADVVMGVLTVHHWADRQRGLTEMARVARRRIVLLTFDPEVEAEMWLFRDYVPEFVDRDRLEFPSLEQLGSAFRGDTRVVTVPVPEDCTDGFMPAYWKRPDALLDPGARAATSGFARMEKAAEQRVVARLAADLESGAWEQRNGELRSMTTLDAGLRLVVTDLPTGG